MLEKYKILTDKTAKDLSYRAKRGIFLLDFNIAFYVVKHNILC